MYLFSRELWVADEVDGLAMEPFNGGKASVEPISEDQALRYLSIPGFEVVETKGAPSPTPTPAPKPAEPPVPTEPEQFEPVEGDAPSDAAEEAPKEPVADPAPVDAAPAPAPKPAAKAKPAK